MRFYPQFEDDDISTMDVEFGYNDWSPWNQELHIDSLVADVSGLLEKWYGQNEFINLKDTEGREVWVKIDGNRRIRLWKRDLRRVQVDIVDMTEVKEIKK